jgi:hypothetical protein
VPFEDAARRHAHAARVGQTDPGVGWIGLLEPFEETTLHLWRCPGVLKRREGADDLDVLVALEHLAVDLVGHLVRQLGEGGAAIVRKVALRRAVHDRTQQDRQPDGDQPECQAEAGSQRAPGMQ